MEPYRLKTDAEGHPRVEVPYRGQRLLRHPMFNKGTAFTREERAALGLEGILPDAVSTLEQQEARVYRNIMRKEDPLERYIGLAALQDRNEVLFYRLLVDHIEELMPIVYTPTVGKACQEYSHIFRRARGIWITPGHRGRIEEVLANAPYEGVRLIVVTDNERILGLGDQGAGGMGIPIGKLALYTAAAGIHPTQCLPVSLDVGTDNQALLEDELYLGWRHPRLRGEDYYSLVDEFVHAVRYRFPKALLQWEDFKKGNAFLLLDKYRKVITSFNDDIQGTAAMAVAGVISGSRATGIPLAEQRTVILGAGAAGVGIARLLRSTLEREGLRGETLVAAIAILDSHGLLATDQEIAEKHKRDFAWPPALAERYGLGKGRPRDLEAVVRAVKPTVLIGTSGNPGTFTEGIVRAMAAQVERPVILPMSNPTSKSEATPADLVNWTGGRALVATGSPFDPVRFGSRVIEIGQANNSFVFSGMGLGVLVAEAKEVTDAMFAAAADRLAAEVTESDLRAGRLFPRPSEIRRVEASVAEAVVEQAGREGVGKAIPEDAIPGAVRAAMWDPAHPRIVPA
ncbi:MAG TPA: NAD-dependent malic enzyme [Anaeromyxobacteraceae bacterium]|nr:NAD-dependent malic enzyme [Anaeromyxobacteraceae bacterium]